MTLSENDYLEFARQGYNRIPLMREVLADLDTPVSTYLKLADRPYSYLLESVEGGEKWGRYSIIGLPSTERLELRAGAVVHVNDDNRVEIYHGADPLSAVAEFGKRFRVAPVAGLPRFTGGLVGYFGYDIVNYVEPRLAGDDRPDSIGSADAVLMVSEEVVVFDNLSGRLFVIVHADPGQPDGFQAAGRRLDELTAMLRAPLTIDDRPGETVPTEGDFRSNFERVDFEAAVEKARQYIYEGDVFQVVLSQRLDIPFAENPVNLYRALRTVNPSPYMYLIDLGEEQIVGSSPEILVRLEDGVVTVRPIAGTRRRGRDEADDERLAGELISDPKELAEHLMLVDLGRNDVGRVAETGSVQLTEKMKIERYSHVMHIVSNVTGRLAPDLDAMDVLKAAFPAGTVSGAPKIRAMEIIRELEPERRGIYAGAVGYLGWNGNMDTAIAIRTAVLKDGRLFIQAGAGIVADSVPAQEYMETMNKGRAVFRAVTLAASGLSLEGGDL